MSTPADRLANRIFLGMIVGVTLGALLRLLFPHVNGLESLAKQTSIQLLDPLGRIFLRLLFLVVVPLVFASLALGVVQLGRLDRLGPMAGRTFALFGLNMAIGVGLGLLVMNGVKPGTRLEPETREKIQAQFKGEVQKQESRSAEVTAGPTQRPLPWLVDTFLPANMLRAVVGDTTTRIGDVLPLILFALLIGAAGTTLPEAQRQSLQQLLELLSGLMTRIVGWALQLAPVAVAAMLLSTVINLGLQFLIPLLWFTVSVLVVMAIHCFGTMSLLLRFLSSRSPVEFFRAIRTILFTAFSTSSSNATLPTSLQVTQERLKVSAPVAGFVLPLGATMNMSGTALYEGCVVLFIAQVYGVDLSLSQQIILLLLTVLSAVAVAGIPGASLPLIIGLLANFQIPAEGIGLILGVDRLLDMARTTLNVAADVVTAVIVDESEQRSQ
ncbi:MAG: dicarboxylate/amino acid:cation symporter [Verrucomicrobia bacterium]|nr:dicarboxylate/amino acid:cation symporter [Verrucomicrobiota bacterium]